MPDEISEEDLKNMSPEEISELQKKNCIFCKIASREIPSKILHETDSTIAILDINPASEGHILIMPKEHYMILPHIPDDVLAKLFSTVKIISKTLLTTFQLKGTSVFIANGMAAGQKAPHVIMHVIPRREADGILELPNYVMNDEQISKLRSSLKPYFTQVFGKSGIKKEESKDEGNVVKDDPKHNKIVDAEFVEEPKHSKKGDDKKDAGKKKVEKSEKNEASVKSKNKEKSSNTAKQGNGKVSLDDISKLFG